MVKKLRKQKKYEVKFYGKKLIVLKNVFNPNFLDSKLLARTIKNLGIHVEKSLDLGTGCGIQAIFLASKSEKIDASDINKYALDNAKINAKLYNLQNKINLVKSDLFSNISDKYDLIIFNPPFFSQKPKDIIEKAVTSYKNNILKRFFKDVKKFLKENGKVIMVFSDVGNLDYFLKLAKETFSKIKILNHEKNNRDNYFVYQMGY